MVSENTIIKSFERVTAEGYGARFYRVDLHFHTPASDDARGADKYGWDYYDKKTFPRKVGDSLDYYKKVKKKQEEILEASRKLAKDIVERFRDEKINLVAITDHNSIGTLWNDPESFKDIMDLAAPTWYELIDDEAQKLNKDRTVLTILPGVEISTSDIHILAVFPPQKPRRKAHFIICDLLNEMGFEVEDWGTNKAGKTSVYNTIQLIAQKGGLPIIAHADAHSKALFKLYEMKSAAMRDVLTNKYLSAIEIKKYSYYFKWNNEVDGILNTWIRSLRISPGLSSIAYFQGSDAHSPEPIGQPDKYTFVKMTEPSFSGLNAAVHMPAARIMLYNDLQKLQKQEKKSGWYIYGMEINQPYFKKRTVRFNRFLNCVVGRLESGKTTLFQLMQQPVTPDGHKEIQGSIRIFIEKIVNAQSYYYVIGKDPRNQYLYSIDKKENSAGKLDWQQVKDLQIMPRFYEPDKVNLLIDSSEAFSGFIEKRFGTPNEENIKRFNDMFAISLFVEEEKQQLLYAEADGDNYKLYLNEQWNRGKEKRIEFSGLDNSLRRIILISVIIISGTTGPLIVDAPEEYFNNQDIIDYLVPIIKNYKDRRQMILFTNHPLLAVNTDPENYILLEQKKWRGKKVGRIEPGFSIDKEEQKEGLINLMEGSLGAFNKRKIRYSIND